MCECGSHRSIMVSVFALTLLSLSPMLYFALRSDPTRQTVSHISNEEWRRQEHLCPAASDTDLRDCVLEDH